MTNWDTDIVTVRDALPPSIIDGFTGETPHPSRLAFERIVAEAGRAKTEVLNQDITATATRLELEHLRDLERLHRHDDDELDRLRADKDTDERLIRRLSDEAERLQGEMKFLHHRHGIDQAEIEQLREAARLMLKQVDEVERTAVIRDSDIYRALRAAVETKP